MNVTSRDEQLKNLVRKNQTDKMERYKQMDEMKEILEGKKTDLISLPILMEVIDGPVLAVIDGEERWFTTAE